MSTAVAEKAQAKIALEDAAEQRRLNAQREQFELAEKKAAADRARKAAAYADKQERKRLAEAEAEQRRKNRRANRTARREAFRAAFAAALGGRLIAILVCLAVATAWDGQYSYLRTGEQLGGLGLPMVFALAGATALEILGLAMGAIVRDAGQFRDRVLWARLVMWSVIGFSAWSNGTHNGPVLAVMSVAGPAAWEVHERWQHRKALHQAGLLRQRPVRPRFPLDQVLLYPAWSFHAYRVAVRDRIEDTNQALTLAATERTAAAERKAARKATRTLARQGKKWAPIVQQLVAAERTAALRHAEAVVREAESVVGAAALLYGPGALLDVVDKTQTQTQNDDETQTQKPKAWTWRGRKTQTQDETQAGVQTQEPKTQAGTQTQTQAPEPKTQDRVQTQAHAETQTGTQTQEPKALDEAQTQTQAGTQEPQTQEPKATGTQTPARTQKPKTQKPKATETQTQVPTQPMPHLVRDLDVWAAQIAAGVQWVRDGGNPAERDELVAAMRKVGPVRKADRTDLVAAVRQELTNSETQNETQDPGTQKPKTQAQLAS